MSTEASMLTASLLTALCSSQVTVWQPVVLKAASSLLSLISQQNKLTKCQERKYYNTYLPSKQENTTVWTQVSVSAWPQTSLISSLTHRQTHFIQKTGHKLSSSSVSFRPPLSQSPARSLWTSSDQAPGYMLTELWANQPTEATAEVFTSSSCRIAACSDFDLSLNYCLILQITSLTNKSLNE